MRERVWLLAAVACGLGGALPPPPPPIGFVDVVRVQQRYEAHLERLRRSQEEFRRKRETLRQRLEALDKRVRKEVALYERGSKEYDRLVIELRLEQERIKLELQALENGWKRERLRLMDDFVRALKQAVDAEAQARKLRAVFMHRPLEQVRTLEDLVSLDNQWVLYRDRALDLTAAVLARLNRGGAGAPRTPRKE